MPKRSNTFQRVILLTRTHLSDGATVTESKLLLDSVSGEEREVDICVEGQVGGEPIIVSIECRDHGRACDVKWIDEMKAKHERLPTNLLVLVSSSGFSKQAVNVAFSYGIKLLTLEELGAEGGEKLFGDIESLWSKVFTLTPTKVIVRVAASEGMQSENVSVAKDTQLFSHSGSSLGAISETVERLLNSKSAVEYFAREGTKEHKGFELRWEPVSDVDGNPLCLQKIDPLIFRPIEMIHITGSCNFDISEFPIISGRLGNIKVVWGTGQFLGEKSLLVATQQQSEVKLTIAKEPN